MKEKLQERFLRYVSLDTQSNPRSAMVPSSENQQELARMLVRELHGIGLTDARTDENAYVMATLPANSAKKLPSVGFIAHMDTSPDMPGGNIRPVTHHNYDGKDIVLNSAEHIVMRVNDFPALRKYTGQTLITSDGTTLLGADNKAGIAEIMTALEYLVENPQISHGPVRIAFTPDEEIGRGATHFDVGQFHADFAYTVDGGELGELQFENFNAAHLKVDIQGRNIHPGEAKGKMINALLLGMEFNDALPADARPEHTEGYEGFFHLTDFSGTVEQAVMEYIIRDHSHQKFEQKKNTVRRIAASMNHKYGKGAIQLTLKDQYYNMLNKITPVAHIVNLAKEAMEELDIAPVIRPIRGGTDGARLSYAGLPCPNLFTGGHNFHGRYEFIPLESMEKASRVIVKIIELIAEKDQLWV